MLGRRSIMCNFAPKYPLEGPSADQPFSCQADTTEQKRHRQRTSFTLNSKQSQWFQLMDLP